MDSKNFPSYIYKKQGPLAIPLSEEAANYEDRILINEIKRNMDSMVADAEAKGVTVKTEMYSPKKQKIVNKRFEGLNSVLAPTGAYSSDSFKKEVNVPRTPRLENYLIMAEEMSHQFDKPEYQNSINDRLGVLTNRYEEEKRAKSAALDRVGGYLTPESKNFFRATMDTYIDNLIDSANKEEDNIKTGNVIKQRGPLSDFVLKNFWDTSRRPHQVAASEYWKDETKPSQAIKELYPELKKYR